MSWLMKKRTEWKGKRPGSKCTLGVRTSQNNLRGFKNFLTPKQEQSSGVSHSGSETLYPRWDH